MTRRPSDDLFENTRMSFGEHLEDLRKTLIRCMIFIGIGCTVGFFVADKVVSYLQVPLLRAIKEYNDGAALKKYIEDIGFYPPEIRNLLERGLAPEKSYIDPGELAEALRQISPDLVKEIDLTPYRFKPSWIEPRFVEKLAKAISLGEDAKPVRAEQLRAINNLLTSNDLELLSDLQNTANDRDSLIEVLNRLIENRQIHKHEAFAPMMSKAVWTWKNVLIPIQDNQLQLMKVQVDKAPEDADLSRRLNRLLVAGVFPEQIATPTIDLIPIQIWRDISQGTQALSPHEVFMVWIKAALITGLILAGPFVFHQVWMFVAAGLYPHEQKYVYYYLPISILLFVGGVCLAFFFVFDPVLKFLFSFNSSMGISPQLRIGEWLSFVMFLPLGFGIAFQLPLVMLFTNRVGLMSIELYKNNWRLAVLIISVLSMLLTPADPISMIMLGGPLTLLYFFGIALCKWMPRHQNPFAEDAVTTT